MLAVLIANCTEEFSGFLPSAITVPSKSVNEPCVLVMPRCTTVKEMSVCDLSTVHVPVASASLDACATRAGVFCAPCGAASNTGETAASASDATIR